MIYQFLKIVVAAALRIFYNSFSINKPYPLPTDGPLIVVGNHPNTFMDPLIIATLFKQQVGFLGNASIFVNGFVNSIFKYFGVIPIYRQQDVASGVAPDNSKTFSACYSHLEDGNAIMLFPEGTSFSELKLRKIKTGTARIALGVEEQNDYKLGVRIIPIGLYYSNPAKFRSKIYVNIGEMIQVNSFDQAHKNDPTEAVKSLTKEIRKSLEQLVIHTHDNEQESLFLKIKRIYQPHLSKTTRPKTKHEEFILTKEITKAIQYFKVSFPDKFDYLKTKIDYCCEILDKFKASTAKIPNAKNRFISHLKVTIGAIYALITFPVFLLGLIQNYLPFSIPYWIAITITKEKEYHAPIMLTIGIFIFPLYYFLSFWIFTQTFELQFWSKALYFLSMPASGYFALHYYRFLKRGLIYAKVILTFRSSNKMIKELDTLRNQIIKDLDDATSIYLKRL